MAVQFFIDGHAAVRVETRWRTSASAIALGRWPGFLQRSRSESEFSHDVFLLF